MRLRHAKYSWYYSTKFVLIAPDYLLICVDWMEHLFKQKNAVSFNLPLHELWFN